MIFGDKWKNMRFQVNISLEFPEYMRRLYVMCVWSIDFLIFSIALLVLGKEAHSHQPYLFMNWWIENNLVTKFLKEEGVEEVAIRNVVIMLFLYTNDVVLLKILTRCTKANECYSSRVTWIEYLLHKYPNQGIVVRGWKILTCFMMNCATLHR